MPTFDTDDDLEQFKLKVGNYGFSGTRLEDLDASEYTLVTIVVDDSSSVEPFRQDMEKCVQKVIEACKKSPRADNLMVRVCTFSDSFHEAHGFKRLQMVKTTDYDGLLGRGGMTALFDASDNAVRASSAYGRNLLENDYSVNGIVFVVTDGDDNRSKLTPNSVRDALKEATSQENLESLISILLGVNVDPQSDLNQFLQSFNAEAGFTQYVSIDKATPQKLAKLADWVSKSISSQSQALGTGGPSQTLTF